jgi:tRNA (adenine37-N6)-methyltransferase
MKQKKLQVFPVGQIKAGHEGFCIEIFDEFRDAMTNLEGFNYIQFFWWCHLFGETDPLKTLVVEKPYKKGPQKIGVFATRSPLRPNLLALTSVQVLSINRDEGKIVIPFIDAEDGSPVLDIKPYLPATERIRDVNVPEWCSHWPKWQEDSAAFNWMEEFENAR